MKLKSIFDDDFDDSINEMDKASSSGGMWIQLKDDGDFIMCVQMEQAQKYKENFDEGPKTRAKANFAVFEEDEKTGEYVFDRLAIWDNVAPSHFKDIMEDRKEHGRNKLYKLKRMGKRKDPKTKYRIFPVRDLTLDEIKMLEGLELLSLTKPEPEDDSPAKKEIAAQIQRLGWTKEQYEVANVKFFGELRVPKDISIADRAYFMLALSKLAPGADPTTIGGDVEGLDLGEDEDFFD